ncbi:MAG: hypothetical protein IJZ82_08205 [Lachnospiraceae bacterium]|nr:hypothetical protein [Lachnospiraceae bacterium]
MRDSFYGWYLKCQSEEKTLAIIPAVHQAGKKRTCSIQVITEEESFTVAFPGKVYRKRKGTLSIGRNQFHERGIYLAVDTKKLHMKGRLLFGELTPLKKHIMGPFAYLPFLECSHMVWSMQHLVSGTVFINGEEYVFQNARGYWEGDKGRSFPNSYMWTQSFLPEGSLTLAVADIPLGRSHFRGIIAAVHWKGKEYRMATYLGARIVEIEEGVVRIRQGKLELEAQLMESAEQPLRAPDSGCMSRIVRESVACKVFYRFRRDGHTLFALETDRASFEQSERKRDCETL